MDFQFAQIGVTIMEKFKIMSEMDIIFEKYKSGELTLPSKKSPKTKLNSNQPKKKKKKTKLLKNNWKWSGGKVLYPLNHGQIEFLKLFKESKDYAKVLPNTKGLITQIIRIKGIKNSKWLKPIQKAVKIKGIRDILDASDPRFFYAKIKEIKSTKTTRIKKLEVKPRVQKIPYKGQILTYKLDETLINFLITLKQNSQHLSVKHKMIISTTINYGWIKNDNHLSIIRESIQGIYYRNKRGKSTKLIEYQESIKKLLFDDLPVKEDIKNPFLQSFDFSEVMLEKRWELYIGSGCWKRKRNYIIKKRGCKCQMCGDESKKSSEYHLHHNIYDRLGHEMENDLQLLCNECHSGLHKQFTLTELKRMFEEFTYINGALVL